MAPHAHQRRLPPDSVENLQVNTLWDGIFHASTYIFTALGLWILCNDPGDLRLTASMRDQKLDQKVTLAFADNHIWDDRAEPAL